MPDKIKAEIRLWEYMPRGRVWVTSDLHFYHGKVICYSRRPFASLEEMHGALIRNWNEVVQDEDLVIVVGDFAFAGVGRGKAILDQLRGHKWLVLGNHDETPARAGRIGFERVCSDLRLQGLGSGKEYRFCHYPYNRGLWDFVTLTKIFFEILFRPGFTLKKKWERFLSKIDSIRNRPSPDTEDFFYHGHTHSHHRTSRAGVHVGVDAWNYRPMLLKGE